MFEPSWWLWGAVLPLVVAAAVMIVCLQPWRPPSAIRAGIAWPLGLSLGYIVGSVVYLAIKHSLYWPPVEATDFLAMEVLPAAVAVEIIGAIVLGRAPWVRWVGRVVVIAATPVLLLRPFLKNGWSIEQFIGYCGGLAVGMAIVWVMVDLVWQGSKVRLAVGHWLTDHDPLGRGYERIHEEETLAPWLSMIITALGVGATIFATGSVTLGQLGLTLAATMFGAWLAGLFSSRLTRQHSGGGDGVGSAKPQAAVGVAVVLLAGLLITGCFYAEVKPWHAGVLALAPLTAWVGRVPMVRRLRGWQVALIVVVATGIVVAIAVVPAVRDAARAMSESGYE